MTQYPPDPPDLFAYPENPGEVFWFGRGDPPGNYKKGHRAAYRAWWRAQLERRGGQVEAAEVALAEQRSREAAEQLDPELARAMRPELERPPAELAAPPLPAHSPPPSTPPEPLPSPLTRGARVRVWRQPRARAMHQPHQPPDYDAVYSEHEAEAVDMRLRITRISPDRGFVEEVDLFNVPEPLSTLGALRAYLASRYYDGRRTIFSCELVIDTQTEGPWRLDLPPDRLLWAERQAVAEAREAEIRRRYGLPPLTPAGATPSYTAAPAPVVAPPVAPATPHATPPAPAAPASPPPAPGEAPLSRAEVQAWIQDSVRLALEALRPPPASAQPPALGAAAAPAPAQAAQPMTREEIVGSVKDAVAAAMQTTKPADPMDMVRSTISKTTEAVAQITEQKAKLQEALGVSTDQPEEKRDPFHMVNGMYLPENMITKHPLSSFAVANAPIVKALLDGVKDAAKEIMAEDRKGRREEVELAERRARLEQQAIRNAKERAELESRGVEVVDSTAEETTDPSMVNSTSWAPPRARNGAPHHGHHSS